MSSLTRAEAVARAAAIRVTSYSIDLDLTTGPETFRSLTTIRFIAGQTETTFVELKPVRLHAAMLNGVPLDPAVLGDNRLPLRGLVAENELVVDCDMSYSNDGEGLHRFVDPADGRVYLYAMTFLDAAQRVFACFDQPDLKAPVTLRVTADPEWTVLANAPGRRADGVWEFAETPPLATYFITLVAGPYHAVKSEHDGIPLGLYCRDSLAPHLDAKELFAFTGACLDRFHELFGVRYPFVKYDQAFVPEFNAGAMENPGCVTFRDDLVFRSAVTEAERERRYITIAHEMAHMWFGDLVTMRWWDDLWLNESFADYLGVRVAAEAGHPGAWTTFTVRDKARGYEADQRPSTHPVAPTDVSDAARALLNFDGISYGKGAAALRQLAAWVSDEAFVAGLRDHITQNAYGNATLADFLVAVSAASGRDLGVWAAAWLRTAQVDTLRPLVTASGGRYESVVVEQTSPVTLRPHRINIGLYDGGAPRPYIPLDVHGGQTEVPALVGAPVADLLVLNDGDLTYAKIRLDATDWERLPTVLPTVDDPVTRGVVWQAVWDAVRDAERPASALIRLVRDALPVETDTRILEIVLDRARDVADRFVPPAGRADALAVIAVTCVRLLGAHPLAAARGVASSTVDTTLLSGWLDGHDVPDGVTVDADLRWRILHRLVVLCAADPERIETELAGDRTAAGEEWAARCRASQPSADAKRHAWRLMVDDVAASNRIVLATAEGFWQPEHAELCVSYVDQYFVDMPVVAERRSGMALGRLAERAFPRFAADERTRDAARALLARADLDPAVRRAVVDGDDELAHALAARALMT